MARKDSTLNGLSSENSLQEGQIFPLTDQKLLIYCYSLSYARYTGNYLKFTE